MKIRSIKILVLIGVTLVFVSIVSVHAATPGFDCSNATTEVEKLICSDDRLADLDKQMAEIFKAKLSGMGENEKKAMKKEQNLWLKSRQKILGASANREDKLKTLSKLYEKKITELNLKADSSGKNKSATVMPSAKDICELCRLFSDSTQRLSLLSNTKGSEDINNDGIPEITKTRVRGSGPISDVYYSDIYGNEINPDTDQESHMPYSFNPFRSNGITYMHKIEDEFEGANESVIYMTPKNEVKTVCEFNVKIEEKPVPSQSKYIELSEFIKSSDRESLMIKISDKTNISVEKIGRKSTQPENEGYIDIDNDGKKERLLKLNYFDWPHGDHGEFTYYDILDSDGKDILKSEKNNLFLKMQEVNLTEDNNPHSSSWNISFFEFKGNIYCDLNDKSKHVVKIFENGKIHDVCTFERKKVYTLANPCK